MTQMKEYSSIILIRLFTFSQRKRNRRTVVLVEHVVDLSICVIANRSPVFCFAFSLECIFRRSWLCLPVGVFLPDQHQLAPSSSGE